MMDSGDRSKSVSCFETKGEKIFRPLSPFLRYYVEGEDEAFAFIVDPGRETGLRGGVSEERRRC